MNISETRILNLLDNNWDYLKLVVTARNRSDSLIQKRLSSAVILVKRSLVDLVVELKLEFGSESTSTYYIYKGTGTCQIISHQQKLDDYIDTSKKIKNITGRRAK